tara:strand:- start:162 stop:392 length:231 start_codon:yes stop_codon:yes gene_type:complete
MSSNEEKLKSFWMGWSKTYRLKGHQVVEAENMQQATEKIQEQLSGYNSKTQIKKFVFKGEMTPLPQRDAIQGYEVK